MSDQAILGKYFQGLTSFQLSQYTKFADLFKDWNTKVNMVSRKDMDHLYERHILHSLGIAKFIQFKKGSRVLDIGTGGGFPGIPLAIMFPEVEFVLVDSIGKKIKVVNELACELNLKNVIGIHQRAENVDGKFDFIVSRAVTRLANFIPWTKGKLLMDSKSDIRNGLLYLKGGDLSEELAEVKLKKTIIELKDYFEEAFFETKKVLYIPLSSR